MKKEKQLDLCIGKCFNMSSLNEDDMSCMENVTQSDLMSKNGLNQDQADFVVKWVKKESQRIKSEGLLEPKEEIESEEEK